MNEFMELLKKFDDTVETAPQPPLGKVLVIDDDLNIRQGLERTLKQRHYEVVITTNGKDGIDSLSDDICVVLLDVKLPQIDGAEVYNLLKQKKPGIPIIFYSAYPGTEEIARRCLELKPYAFIEKGVSEDIDRLYSLIEQAARERGKQR